MNASLAGKAGPQALLSVRDLTVEFAIDAGVITAVNGVSFDLNAGEILAMVGESGCGKSATALALLRLIADPPGRIVGGEVRFRDRDLLSVDETEIRDIRGNRIAMIFQEPMTSLNPVYTLGRQLGEPLALHKNLGGETLLAKCIALLESVSIPEPQQRLQSYPHQFSGGMRQRVMIAMGMSCDPDIVIADEPTTALDVTIQAQLLELLKTQVEKEASGAATHHPQSRSGRALRRPRQRHVCGAHRRKRRRR
jgi:ABC-type dipeptide/oligopeptide/nickel transport system ATPase component